MKKIVLLLLTGITLIGGTYAQSPGHRDSTFGVDGLVIAPVKGWDVTTGMVLQPDGKILLGGYSEVGSQSAFTVARLLPDGSPDVSFGQGGVSRQTVGNFDNQAHAIALQLDGKILLAGYSNIAGNNNDDAVLMRFLPNGILDSTFNGNGIAILSATKIDRFYALAIQNDGKILAAGRVSGSNKALMFVSRYNANGTLDLGYGSAGASGIDFGYGNEVATALALQPDGKLVVGGTTRNGVARYFSLVRLTATGTIDVTFGSLGLRLTSLGGNSAASGISSLLLQPDGSIVAVGYSVDPGAAGWSYLAMARFLSNGGPDISFGFNSAVRQVPIGTYCSGEAAALLPNGKILVAGRCENGPQRFDMLLTQFLPNGAVDTTFGVNGTFLTDVNAEEEGASAVVVQPDGRILVAGGACSALDGSSDFLVTRFIPNLSVGVIDAPNPLQSPLVYPNPIRTGETTVKYELLQASEIRFEWYDAGGKLLQVEEIGERNEGEHRETLLLPDQLANGIYLLNIRTDRGNTPVRIVVQRN